MIEIGTRFRMGYDEYENSYECNFLWNLILIAEQISKIDNKAMEIKQR